MVYWILIFYSYYFNKAKNTLKSFTTSFMYMFTVLTVVDRYCLIFMSPRFTTYTLSLLLIFQLPLTLLVYFC